MPALILTPDITRRTFRNEQWRAVTSGILEGAGSTFLLLIAIKVLHAGPASKALIAGGTSIGLLLSPFVVSTAARMHRRPTTLSRNLALIGFLSFLGIAFTGSIPIFTIGALVGLACWSSAVPLMTQVYQDNYPASSRGHLFSRSSMIRIGSAVLFSELAGRTLSSSLSHAPVILLAIALASLGAAGCFQRTPSRPLDIPVQRHPLAPLRLVHSDRLFRHTLVCWMLMGFANLMMIPLRVEYLGNPTHGLGLSPGEIAFLAAVVPNTARLLMSAVWGWLFDRMNFFVLRIVLNLGFAIGIASFFTSNSIPGLILGAIIFGVSNAGGDVAWGLWVTRLAPPGQAADYMSVHTFLTGVRGLLAPMIAFYACTQFSIASVAIASSALILIATAMLIPESLRANSALAPAPPPDELADRS